MVFRAFLLVHFLSHLASLVVEEYFTSHQMGPFNRKLVLSTAFTPVMWIMSIHIGPPSVI